MRLVGLSIAWALGLGLASAQTLSGLSFDGQDVVKLMWAFDGQSAGSYDFYLCAGDETGSYESLEKVITNSDVTPGDMISFRVDRNVGGNEPNAYFLKVNPTNKSEKWSGFTSHFTLTNMKGSFSARVSEALKSMTPVPIPISISLLDKNLLDEDEQLAANYNASESLKTTLHTAEEHQTEQQDSEEDTHFELRKRLAPVAAPGLGAAAGAAGVAGAGAAAAPAVGAAAPAEDPHTIPYGEQTGLTKYAPEPKMAGTTIPPLDKFPSPTPQYPPFPFVKATTYLGAPTVQYTDTAYLSFTTHSIENTAAPAAAPTLDKRMQRWLERWQD